MSQEKVDAYKKKKATRKDDYASKQKKQKAGALSAKIVFGVIVVALVFALVVTGVNIVKGYIDGKPNYEATEYVLDDYMQVGSNGIDAEAIAGEGAEIQIGENGETIISSGSDAAEEGTVTETIE